MIHDFTPVAAVVGGALIGLSASLMLWTTGQVAGISGIWGGLVQPLSLMRVVVGAGDLLWRILFVGGLAAGALLLWLLVPQVIAAPETRSTWAVISAGLLVGVGTRMGSGCTSGHGVCGLTRFSVRSLVAVLVFMGVGFALATAIGWFAGGVV